MERLIEANDSSALRALEREQRELAAQAAVETRRRQRAESLTRFLVVFLIGFMLATPGLVCLFVEQATEETRVMLTEQREATWRAAGEADYWRSQASVRGQIAQTATRCCLTICGALDPSP